MNNFELSNKTSLKFSPVYAILVGFAVTITMQIVQGLVSLPAFFNVSLYQFLLPLAFLASTVACIFLLQVWFKVTLFEIKNWILHPTSIMNFVLGFGVYIFALPFAEFLTGQIPTNIPFLQELYEQFSASFEMILDYKIAAFLTVCILAPILEEIIFRGFILRGMLNNGTNPWIAIIMSGIIFGAAHMNPWQFIGAGILGGIFGFVYYRTKSLLLCMILHALNNMMSFFLLLKYQNMDETLFDSNSTSPIFICLLISITIGYYFYKKTTHQQWN